jgi:hypothetical protein
MVLCVLGVVYVLIVGFAPSASGPTPKRPVAERIQAAVEADRQETAVVLKCLPLRGLDASDSLLEITGRLAAGKPAKEGTQ